MSNSNSKSLVEAFKESKVMTEIENEGIISPSMQDTEWAINFTSEDGFFSNKASRFLSAVSSSNLFRVTYAIKLNDRLDENKKFITVKIGQKALEESASSKDEAIIETLLNHGFIRKYGLSHPFLERLVKTENKQALRYLISRGLYSLETDDDGLLLFTAATNDKEDICDLLLQEGVDSSKALTIAIGKGFDYTERKIRDAILRNVENQVNNTQKISVDKNLEEAPVEEQVECQTWDAMTDDIIAKHETVPNSNIKLETIFNFIARNITTICTADKSAPPAIHIQNFKELEDDNVFREAWQKLKDQNKNPLPFIGNDNFTVVKSKSKQKIKIEQWT